VSGAQALVPYKREAVQCSSNGQGARNVDKHGFALSLQVMRFMDDESITGVKEFAVGNYLVQMVSDVMTACKLNQHRS